MEKRRARRLAGEAGFTLVELLVVIAILAVLAGIVVFAVGGVQDKGTSAASKTDCSELQAAEEAYFAEQGSYTASESALVGAGFLHGTSTLHDTISLVAAGGGSVASYSITGCA
jgi:prepilin-type N-terminal cleavage/methylation domain-containing protein